MEVRINISWGGKNLKTRGEEPKLAEDVAITEDGKVCGRKDEDTCRGGEGGRNGKSRVGKMKS